jgi:hypothetical protein
VATRPQDLTAASAAALLASLSFYPAPVAMSLVMLLTPTGSLPSPRWHWLAVTIVAARLVTGLADVFSLHPLLDPRAPPLTSPLALLAVAGPLEVIGTAASIVIALAALAAAGSLVVRPPPRQRDRTPTAALAGPGGGPDGGGGAGPDLDGQPVPAWVAERCLDVAAAVGDRRGDPAVSAV